MKEIFTLLLIISSSLFTRAQSIEGVISFTNLSRQHVLIEVDGKQYPDCGAAMTVRNLSHGLYKVKVYGDKYRRNNNRPLLYENTVWVKSRLFVDIVVNRFGRVFVDEREIKGRWPDEDEQSAARAMNDEMFETFYQTLTKEPFDNSKMTIAKPVIDQNYFTAEQVKQLVPLLTFEDNKLEMARLLYGRTVDTQNYFIIYTVFSFPSTKEKLADFIKNYK